MSQTHLQCGAGVVVEASDVAGGFYCEHAFFAAKAAAPAALVGFVHVPPEQHPRAPLRVRDGHIREVLIAGLRDNVEAARRRHSTRCKVLFTGYGPWGEVQHNPSGDFVSHPSNLRALLVGVSATQVGRRADGVLHGDVDGVEVAIAAVVLAVDDSAIDGGATSVQAAIATHDPDVVVGLGVHRKSDTIRIECRVTDVALVPHGRAFVRDPTKTKPTIILRDDRLYRCVLNGWPTSTTPSTSSTSSSAFSAA